LPFSSFFVFIIGPLANNNGRCRSCGVESLVRARRGIEGEEHARPAEWIAERAAPHDIEHLRVQPGNTRDRDRETDRDLTLSGRDDPSTA
jgi:hypothetical protein